MGKAAAEVIVIFATLIVVFAVVLLVFSAVKFVDLKKKFVKTAERRARAKRNPYTRVDIQFMIDAGMTPAEIRKAVDNAFERAGY